MAALAIVLALGAFLPTEYVGIAELGVISALGMLVAFVLMLILDRLPRRRSDGGTGDGVPGTLYLWTYISGILLNVFFVHRPSVAFWGAVLMGLVAIPYAWSIWVGRD